MTGAKLYLALAALGAVGLTGLGLTFALDRAIARPVEQLVEVMEKARQGDLDAEVPVVNLDEFGWLGENFNRMLRKLKENDESLRGLMDQVAQFNESLQKQVALATEELAKKNEELGRANHRLFEAQRALGNSERLASLGQLASQIAHEIGTPLNSIYGHIQLLGADEIPEGAKKRVTIVESQVERLTKIIENVLRTLRLPDAQLSEIEVAPVLTGVAAFMQPVAESRKIKLEVVLAPALPRIYVDPRQLEQVLLNLITNALDAMPEGGTLTVGAEEKPDGAESVLLVRVKDTGHGIKPEDLHRIFEPFFTTKAPGTGTGLGLPICKQILRTFRGALTAESDGPGKGACFTVRLPAMRQASTDERREPDAEERRTAAVEKAPEPAAPAPDEESATRTFDSSATTIDGAIATESARLARQTGDA
jgi:signal transduction histidine kinase